MSILKLKMNEEVWKKSINQVKPKWPGTVKHFINHTYFAMTMFWRFWHVSNHLSNFVCFKNIIYLFFPLESTSNNKTAILYLRTDPADHSVVSSLVSVEDF